MTLRIISDVGPPGIARAPGETGSSGAYLERLVKLVPAEAIGAYPLLMDAATKAGAWAQLLLCWALLGLVVLIRAKTTATDGNNAQWPAVAIAAVSCVIWIYAMGGDFGLSALMAVLGVATANAADAIFLRNLALVSWTIVVPLYYKGDPR